MSRINQAYTVLSDPRQRYMYNLDLDQAARTSATSTAATAGHRQKSAPMPHRHPAQTYSAFASRRHDDFRRPTRRFLFSPVFFAALLFVGIILAGTLFTLVRSGQSTASANPSNTSVGVGDWPASGSATISGISSAQSTTPSTLNTIGSNGDTPGVSSVSLQSTPNQTSPSVCSTNGMAQSYSRQVSLVNRQIRELEDRIRELGSSADPSVSSSDQYQALVQLLSEYQAEQAALATASSCP